MTFKISSTPSYKANEEEVYVHYHLIECNAEFYSEMYSRFISSMYALKLSKSSLELLTHVLYHYPSVEQTFKFNKEMRKELADKTGKSPTSYLSSMRDLLKFRIVDKVSYGLYTINASYATSEDDCGQRVSFMIKGSKT